MSPYLVRVRLELARAFFLKGEDTLARQHFEHVLAGDVPEEVKENVNLFLAEISARRRWSFNVGFALAPDTNIGGGSDERVIYIYGLPFERDAQELTTSGIGLSFWGGAEYQTPLADDLRLRAGAQASRQEYKGSDFDQHFVALHLGPRWLLDDATEASLLVSARQRWSGTTPDYRDLGGRLEVAHRLGPRLTAFAQTSWHDRRYRTRTHLDGPLWDTSLRGSWVVTPTVRADLSGGYTQQRPKSRHERNRGRWLGAGITVPCPWLTVGGSAEMRWTDYEPGWFPFVEDNGPREDRTRSLRLSTHNRPSRSWASARSWRSSTRPVKATPSSTTTTARRRASLRPAVLTERIRVSCDIRLPHCGGRSCRSPLRILARILCASRPGRRCAAGRRCRGQWWRVATAPRRKSPSASDRSQRTPRSS